MKDLYVFFCFFSETQLIHTNVFYFEMNVTLLIQTVLQWGSRGGRRVSAKGAWQHTKTTRMAGRLLMWTKLDAPEGNFLQISHNNTSLFTASLTCFNATWQINFVLCFVPELTPFFFNRKGQISLFYLLLCGQGLPQRLQSSLLHCRLNPSELCWRRL